MGSGLVNIDSTPTSSSNARFVAFTASASTAESSITIPRNAIKFQISLLTTNASLTISHISGGTSNSATRFSFPMGHGWCEENIEGKDPLTIYLTSSKMGDTVQVLYWLKS